jgi:hypothetical protein
MVIDHAENEYDIQNKFTWLVISGVHWIGLRSK